MAPRTRKHVIRYGGELAGVSNNGDQFVTPENGTHSCTDETHPGPPFRSGGPLFVTKKMVYIKRLPHNYVFYHSILGWYNGRMWVKPYIPSPEPSPISLSGWGAKGVNRTAPLHPIYNLGVSIGELKDLPGMVSQTVQGFKAIKKLDNYLTHVKRFPTVKDLLQFANHSSKTPGDAYLYGAFGLVPMLQDLLFLLKMREKLDKKIAWLRRHNGKSIRRKIELDKGGFSEDIPRNVSPIVTVGPTLSSDLYGSGQGGSQPFPILKTYQRRIWFAAKYRFYIPELAKDPRISPPSGGLVRDLLGLTPDPAIIYKLFPWSWLLDWFTSAGAALGNIYLLAKHHTVIEYAYVMCSESFTYQAPGYITMHSGKLSPSFQWVEPDRYFGGISRTEYYFRQREWANPFGFGVTFASLSAYQLSILVALGLSRGGKHSAPRS